MSNDLSCSTHVFVQQDAVRWFVEQPYHGPHNVIERGSKTFTVNVDGKQEVISMDRLKPAHIEDSVPIDVPATDDSLLPPPTAVPTPPAAPTPPPTTRTTQSGRHVHWPD